MPVVKPFSDIEREGLRKVWAWFQKREVLRSVLRSIGIALLALVPVIGLGVTLWQAISPK